MEVAQIFACPRVLHRLLRASELPGGGLFEIVAKPLSDEWSANKGKLDRVAAVCNALCVSEKDLEQVCGLLSEEQRACDSLHTEFDLPGWLGSIAVRYEKLVCPPLWQFTVPRQCVQRRNGSAIFSASLFVSQSATEGHVIRVAGLCARDAGLLKTSQKVTQAVESGRMPAMWVDIYCAVQHGSTTRLTLRATAHLRDAKTTRVLYSQYLIVDEIVEYGWQCLEICFAGRVAACTMRVNSRKIEVPEDVLLDSVHSSLPNGFVPWVVSMTRHPALSPSRTQKRLQWHPCLRQPARNSHAMEWLVPKISVELPLGVTELMLRLCAYKNCHIDTTCPWHALWYMALWESHCVPENESQLPSDSNCLSREERGYNLLQVLFTFDKWDAGQFTD